MRVRDFIWVRDSSLGLCLDDTDNLAVFWPFGLELNLSIGRREQRVVFSDANVHARVYLGTALTNDDVARDYGFAAKFFDAEAFAFRIASVLGTSACFLVSHNRLLNQSMQGNAVIAPPLLSS